VLSLLTSLHHIRDELRERNGRTRAKVAWRAEVIARHVPLRRHLQVCLHLVICVIRLTEDVQLAYDQWLPILLRAIANGYDGSMVIGHLLTLHEASSLSQAYGRSQTASCREDMPRCRPSRPFWSPGST
jgi:hypothetical protein